ncbi:MAG: autotransporter domain-containing protein [Akkermansia sp.]
MKLHLPCGLRKALLSVLALLSPLTATPAATTIATATLGAAALTLVPQAQADVVELDLSNQTVTYSVGNAPQFSTLTTNANSKITLAINSTLAQASEYTDAVTLQGTLQLGDATYGGGATFQTNGDLTIEGMVTREWGTSHLVAGGSFTLTGRVGGDGSPFEVKAGADVSFSPTAALTTTVQKVTFTGAGDHTFTVGDKANLTLAQGIVTNAGTTTITGSGSLCVQGATSCTVSTLDFGSGALKLETGMTASGSTDSAVKTLTLTGDADLTIASARLMLGSVTGSAVSSNTVKALGIRLYGAASGVNLTTFVDGMIYLGDDPSSASSGSLVTLTDVRLAPSKLVVTGVREVSGTSSIYVTTSTTLGYSTTAGSLTISGGTGHVLGILETASGTADSLVIGTGVLVMFAAIHDEANDSLTIKGNGELKQQIDSTTGVTINSVLTVESRASLTTNGDLSIAGATGTRLQGKVSVASGKTLTIKGSADVDGATLNAVTGKVVLNTNDTVVKATINTDTIELEQNTTLTGRTTAATIDTQGNALTLDSVAFTNDLLNTLTLGDGSLELKGTTQVTITTLTTTTGGALTLGDTAELTVADHDINALLEAFAQIKLEDFSVLNTTGDLEITDEVLNKLSIGADATMKLNGSVRISASDPTHANALLGNIVLTSPDTQDMEISGSQTVRLSGVAAHELYIHEGHAEIELQELTTGNYSEVQLSHGLTMKNGSELGITNATDATDLGSLGEVNLSSSKLTLTGKAGAEDVLVTTDINLSNSDLTIKDLTLSAATSDPEAINVNGDSRMVLIDADLDGYQVLVNSTRTETTADPAVDLGGEVSFNTLTVLNGGVVLRGETTGNIALNSAGASLDLEGKLVGTLTLGGGTLNVKADAGTDIADGSAMTVQALNVGGTIALEKDITMKSLAGNGTLRVEGADNTLTLAGIGTHTGDITLADGVNLKTEASNALGSAGTLEVQGNSTLTLAGDEDKNIDITDTLTVAGQGRDHTLSGSISGGKLVAEATVLILTGELSLTQTSIRADKALLLVNNRSASLGAVTNNGTLTLASTAATTTTAASLGGTGAIAISNMDTLEVAGDAVISGVGSSIAGTLSAGSIELSNTELGGSLSAWEITLGSGITDNGTNSISTGELTVTGNVELTGDALRADETIITGELHLANSTQAELGDVTNSGTLALASTGDTTTTADSVENTGTLSIGATDRLEVSGKVSSTGTTATVAVEGTLTAKDIAITGGNATHLNSISGTVQADEDEGTLSLANTTLGSGATLDGAGVVLESKVQTAEGATGVSLSGDLLEVTGEDNVLKNATVEFAESSIEADSSLSLTSNTDMGKLGTTTVEGALTLEGTGTAPSTLTADITFNGTGSASLTNIALQGSISTTNTNAADAAEGSTSLTLKDTAVSGDLTVVGGTLTLGGNNSVGGAVVISDVVTIVNNGDAGSADTPSLSVDNGTVIKANGKLRVDENNSLDSAIIFDRYGLVEGANPLLTPTDAADPTATFTGTHTQNKNLAFASDGIINVMGSLELNGHLVKKDLISQNNPAETVRLYGVTLKINSDNEAFDLNIASAMQRIELGEDEALGAEGTLTLGNDQTLANNTRVTTQSKDIDLNGKTLTVETGKDLELAGVVNNGSITKTGDAKLTLSNDSEEEKTLTKLTVNEGSVDISVRSDNDTRYKVENTVLAAGTSLSSGGSNTFGDGTGNTGISGTNAEVVLAADELDNAKLVLSHDSAPIAGVTTVTLSGTTGSLAADSRLTKENALVSDVTLSGKLSIEDGVSDIADSDLSELGLSVSQGGQVGSRNTALGNVTLQAGRLSLNGGNTATGKTLTLEGGDDDVRSISVLDDVAEDLSDATLAVEADGSISTQENASLKLGSITGEAELTKVGVGALTLTADNAASFDGTIALLEGTLAAQASGAFGGSAATLVIASGMTRAGSSRLLITGTEGGAPVSYDSDLSVEADATLKTLSDTTWTGLAQLSGAADYTLTKEGAAALILNSNSPNFATAISLNEGRLEVNGSIASAVTMSTGTTLNGSGTLGDVTGAADSRIYVGAAEPSSSTETLTVGQYDAHGADLLLDVTNAGADKLVVTAGAADVSADTLKLHFAGDESAVAEQTRHTIVEAQGTGVAVSGDYGLRIEHNMDTRNAHTVNEGGDVILVLSKNHKGADKNGNRQSVSDALRDIERAGIATGELAQVLTALAHTTSEGQALAALDSLGGVNNTALMTSVLEGALDHTRNLRQMAGQNGATRLELKGSDECCRRYHTTPATELWFAPTASYTRIGGAEGVPSFGRQGYGAMLGVDRSLTPELLLGLSCGYEYSKINITGAQKSTGDNYYLDLYGRVNKGRWAHCFSVGVGVHELMHKRNVGVAGLAPFAGGTKGDISGMSLNLSYEAAVNFRVSERATLAPVFTIDSTAAWLDSYTETSMGNAGLSVNRQDAWSTVLGLGARYSYEFRALTNRTRKRSVLTAQAMLTLDAADQGSSVKAHFIGAPGYDFTQNGPSRDRVGGLLSVGVDLPVTDSWSGFGGVSYELRNDYRSVDGHIGVRYSF